MSYILKSVGPSDVSLADNSVIMRNIPLTVPYLTKATLAAIAAGLITCTPPPPTFTQVSAVVITDSSTGVAATIVAGATTIAAVTSLPTAANAIATLNAQVTKLTADIANLSAIVAVINPEIAALYQVENLTQNY